VKEKYIEFIDACTAKIVGYFFKEELTVMGSRGRESPSSFRGDKSYPLKEHNTHP
jgi:hypothetical protein